MQMHFLTERKITLTALLACAGILLGYVEAILIPDLILPGMKIGLSNIVVLFALITLGNKEAFIIGFVKIVVNSLLFSGITSAIYSLCGLVLCIFAMSVLKGLFLKSKISAVGLSVTGSALFNSGQLIAACIILKNTVMFYYLGYYLLLSAVTGIVTGFIVQIIIDKGVVKNFAKKK